MRTRLTCLVAVALCLFPLAFSAAQQDDKGKDKGKDNAELARSLAAADMVFTAVIAKVDRMAQTNSIPPSTSGAISFKEIKLVGGPKAEGKPAGTFNYTHREGMPNMSLDAAGRVIVATKQNNVVVIVPATEAMMKYLEKVK